MNNDSTPGQGNKGKGGFLGRLLWGSTPESEEFKDGAPTEEGAFRPRFENDTIDAETMAEVMEQLGKKRKIEAIKIYRDATGCGLKDGKEAVERLESKRAA